MKLYLLSSLYLTALLQFLFLPNNAVVVLAQQFNDGPLRQPEVLKSSSSSGSFTIDLALAEGQHDTKAASTFNTRLLGGSLPGPTLRVKKGDWLYVNFKNDLVAQDGTSVATGTYSHPDSTNLHFHGAHVSGERPADDTTLSIEPGEFFRYEVLFPSYHMGGTHWIHPHRHGAGTLQVGGGAAMVLIVEDGPGEVPEEVATAEEVILMVQHFEKSIMDQAADTSGDGLFQLNSIDEFLLVNGQYRPTLSMPTGEWQRWRVVFGGWDRDSLDMELDEDGKSACEMNLLAKDGIYITDYPRPLDVFLIPVGGRADIMVRCNKPVTFTVKATPNYTGGDHLFTVNVVGNTASNTNTILTDRFFEDYSGRPNYLQDLRSTSVSTGCSCDSYLDNNQINGRSFDPNRFLHRSVQGSIVERNVEGIRKHPYHQHVYPFQINSIVNGSDRSDAENRYYKKGDYHDSILIPSAKSVAIRYEATNFLGRMAVHCHRLTHSDKGMINAEDVVTDNGTSSCACTSRSGGGGGFTRAPSNAPTAAPTKVPRSKRKKSKSKKSKARRRRNKKRRKPKQAI